MPVISSTIIHPQATTDAIAMQEASYNRLEKKIQKLLCHIDYLRGSLASRRTHGGKRFRAKKIQTNNHIERALQRLSVLQQKKTVQYLLISPPSSILSCSDSDSECGSNHESHSSFEEVGNESKAPNIALATDDESQNSTQKATGWFNWFGY
jgi:hypothetical protein